MKSLDQTILIVDDDKSNRKMLKELLQEQPQRVHDRDATKVS